MLSGDSILINYSDMLRGAPQLYPGASIAYSIGAPSKAGLLLWNNHQVNSLFVGGTRNKLESAWLRVNSWLDPVIADNGIVVFILTMPLLSEREPGTTLARSLWLNNLITPLLRDRGVKFIDLAAFVRPVADEGSTLDGKYAFEVGREKEEVRERNDLLTHPPQ